ncbi:MAG TPA: NAD(P)-dependent oxidoreductase [Candidatus Hydrogenedentes bacterium]|nr:NAD(P)-dependent oxidoreductase [Candidatus Hydrogenedentota bacterium]HOL75891.1 NAD(P)-dependent oxidoreductase [Candidatus Hydrogenedentota bacterium]HPO85700.1 NAD(P)-dependent oxidoreductase [Candidatus Hydrogenedentota bacterium]
MQKLSPIGLVGLGLVGSALGSRLVSARYPVLGYDIAPAACQKARVIGVRTVPDLKTLGSACNLIFLSLPNGSVVKEVLRKKGDLVSGCQRGTVILDTSTIYPEDTLQLSKELSTQGVFLIDAPLVGSSEEIADGQGIMLVGTSSQNAWFKEVLECLVRKVHFLGKVGSAHCAKLVINLILGANRLVLAEGLALAQKSGINPIEFLDVLRDSAAYSRVMDTKGPRMCAGRFEPPAARLAQHAKDVGLILKLGRSTKARTPVSRLHHRLLREAIRKGWGELDNSAIVKVFLDLEKNT